MAPMRLSISLWTTMGGWPGLIKWAGATVSRMASSPVSVEGMLS
jgi:hypothetical protein